MRTYKERTEDILEKACKLKKRRRIKFISAAASCLSLVLAFNLVLFIPYDTSPPSVAKYSGSEYYSLIRQLNELTYKKPSYKNNFEKWFGSLRANGNDYADSPAASPEDESSYREVTNNQTDGVIEGDLFKRSDRYIYYLKTEGTGYALQAYSIAGETSKLAGNIDVLPDECVYFNRYATVGAEMYLSDDARTATIVAPVTIAYSSRTKVYGSYTVMISIDVSDPAEMREVGRMYVSGDYITSRSVGGDFLLLTQFAVMSNPDFSDESQFIPQTGALGNMESLKMSEIVVPADANAARYTVVCKIDGKTLNTEGHYAFLSYTDTVYVSESHIFTTRSYTERTNFVEYMTEISCIAYDGGELEYVDSVSLAGTVLNQYSMDEYENVLRVATTVTRYEATQTATDRNHVGAALYYDTSASLYCVDLSDFCVIGSLEWFAPSGEEVQSARFDKNTAYVCTAVELTDPVFAIDVSDPENIVYKDTGEIYGYSISMIAFSYDTLLGIGYGESASYLKIELYREGEESLFSVAKYERECYFSADFKAYYIDRENSLIGLSVDDRVYVVLGFDGGALTLLSETPLYGDCSAARATYIDGYLYLFGENGLKVISAGN